MHKQVTPWSGDSKAKHSSSSALVRKISLEPTWQMMEPLSSLTKGQAHGDLPEVSHVEKITSM